MNAFENNDLVFIELNNRENFNDITILNIKIRKHVS